MSYQNNNRGGNNGGGGRYNNYGDAGGYNNSAFNMNRGNNGPFGNRGYNNNNNNNNNMNNNNMNMNNNNNNNMNNMNNNNNMNMNNNMNNNNINNNVYLNRGGNKVYTSNQQSNQMYNQQQQQQQQQQSFQTSPHFLQQQPALSNIPTSSSHYDSTPTYSGNPFQMQNNNRQNDDYLSSYDRLGQQYNSNNNLNNNNNNNNINNNNNSNSNSNSNNNNNNNLMSNNNTIQSPIMRYNNIAGGGQYGGGYDSPINNNINNSNNNNNNNINNNNNYSPTYDSGNNYSSQFSSTFSSSTNTNSSSSSSSSPFNTENSKGFLNQYMIKLGKRPNNQYISSSSQGQPPNQTFETIFELPFPPNFGKEPMRIIGKGPTKNDSKTQCAEKACKVLSDMGLINLSATKGSVASTTSAPENEVTPDNLSDYQMNESKKIISQKSIRCSSLEFENCCLLIHSNGGINGILGPSGMSWKFDAAKRKIEQYAKQFSFPENKIYRTHEVPRGLKSKIFIVEMYLPIENTLQKITRTESDNKKLSENLAAVDACEYLLENELVQPEYKVPKSSTSSDEFFKINYDIPQDLIEQSQFSLDYIIDQNKNFTPKQSIILNKKIQTYEPQMSILDCKSQEEISEIGIEKKIFEERKKNTAEYQRVYQKRTELPIFKQRRHLIDCIKNNQIIIIMGDTGCGKTTQIPQYVIEDMIESNHAPYCNIIMTQPRRISVLGAAERMAYERLEKVGDTIGYQIRFENQQPTGTSKLLVCTPGILLKRMYSDKKLHNVSHLFIDEVHERDIHTDFLLIILKKLLEDNINLRVILMSATIDNSSVSRYFNDCPVFNVSSYSHVAREYFLEDISKQLNDQSIVYKDEQSDDVDHALILQIMTHIVTKVSNSTEDSILVFLPGWEDISQTRELIRGHPLFKNENQFLVLALHSSVSMQQQAKVFDRPPPKVRKIVLSTNIAETSITINDVVYVIDSAKVKLKYHETQRDLTLFQTVWACKSSLKQRRGRAGRVRKDGVCYHLVSRDRYNSLDDFQLPEMRRMPLHELCLQVKVLVLGSIGEFLSDALEPPEAKAIDNAINLLIDLGALSSQQDLTPLGLRLSFIPVDPRIGKMIILSSFFRCLDPILTIASFSNQKNPILNLFNQDNSYQNNFSSQLYPEHQSDHISFLNIFNNWLQSKLEGREEEYCRDFLSIPLLNQILKVKKQLLATIYELGIVNIQSLSNGFVLDDFFNANSRNFDIIRSIICSGLFPNVAKQRKKREFKTLSENTFLHPSSIVYNLFQELNSKDNWVIFEEKFKTKLTFIKTISRIPEISLLLFGSTPIFTQTSQDYSTIAIHGTPIKFYVPTNSCHLLLSIREQMEKALSKYVEYNNYSNHFTKVDYEFEKALISLLRFSRG
ncbi:hypothetical protein DICPUDRAFT_155280 [Dictyostelium purpureum]|uniref:RNA helicase n=1 Tax=Dictyostelium purpureum TaxID=5786 RepID=F0ZTK0_DICPU|nr:uncharacterized protein DICPUDRAFT_155280 [Dictyostelium purpureum]EGC32711.1 hypothetical protein DICPUDRAFT_155280 [Dictyostelium purpureum]|eukprot:XP_003290744.1 hypothetical protein DICPUDRAFT_155280 [Dictyostelium purpureum]